MIEKKKDLNKEIKKLQKENEEIFNKTKAKENANKREEEMRAEKLKRTSSVPLPTEEEIRAEKLKRASSVPLPTEDEPQLKSTGEENKKIGKH